MPRILAFCPKRPLINVGSPVGHTAASYQITKPVRFFSTRASRASLLSLAGWLAEPDGSSYRTYIQVAILLSDDWPSMSAGSLIIIPLEQFWSHKIWVYSSTAALKFDLIGPPLRVQTISRSKLTISLLHKSVWYTSIILLQLLFSETEDLLLRFYWY